MTGSCREAVAIPWARHDMAGARLGTSPVGRHCCVLGTLVALNSISSPVAPKLNL